jgi:hypothetical protein
MPSVARQLSCMQHFRVISGKVPHHSPFQRIPLTLWPVATPAGLSFHFPVNTRSGSLIVSSVDTSLCRRLQPLTSLHYVGTLRCGGHWKWGDQDGGDGRRGKVIEGEVRGWVRVMLFGGSSNQYRWGGRTYKTLLCPEHNMTGATSTFITVSMGVLDKVDFATFTALFTTTCETHVIILVHGALV